MRLSDGTSLTMKTLADGTTETTTRHSDGASWTDTTKTHADGTREKTTRYSDGTSRTHTTKTHADGMTETTIRLSDGNSWTIKILADGTTEKTTRWSDGYSFTNTTHADGTTETTTRYSDGTSSHSTTKTHANGTTETTRHYSDGTSMTMKILADGTIDMFLQLLPSKREEEVKDVHYCGRFAGKSRRAERFIFKQSLSGRQDVMCGLKWRWNSDKTRLDCLLMAGAQSVLIMSLDIHPDMLRCITSDRWSMQLQPAVEAVKQAVNSYDDCNELSLHLCLSSAEEADIAARIRSQNPHFSLLDIVYKLLDVWLAQTTMPPPQ